MQAHNDPDAQTSIFEGKFEIKGVLGRGGMGVVYRARDAKDGHFVALKTLHHTAPERQSSLKREFRVRAGLSHPNLVQLYALHMAEEGAWLSMELINGHDLTGYVRGRPEPSASTPATAATAATSATSETAPSDSTLNSRPTRTSIVAPSQAREVRPAGLNVDATARLHSALTQLLHGLDALHGVGLVHRDVKPSNVLVTPEGRVVLVDFGLAVPIDGLDAASTGRAGTWRYMAPEQAAAEPLTGAADLYSLGVVLYELLTGTPPGPAGTVAELQRWRREHQPLPPEQLVSDCDPALASLAMALLHPEPAARPTAREALATLGERAPLTTTSIVSPHEPLLGRRDEQHALARALTQVSSGSCLIAHVHGESGMGKSHLISSFVNTAASEGALTLVGRCHPNEIVSFKALDAAIDHLALHLRRLSPSAQASLRPQHVRALVRLFPALNGVEAFRSQPSGGEHPALLRQRALGALRELFSALAVERPVVLWLDDVHWGDGDSAELLEGLLSGETPLPILLLLSYRTEERARSVFLRRLREIFEQRASLGLPSLGEVMNLQVGPLDLKVIQEVFEGSLGRDRVTSGLLELALRQTGGNAFLVTLMARHLGQGDVPEDPHLDVEGLLSANLSGLSAEAQALMRVASITLAPTAEALLVEATSLPIIAQTELGQLAAMRLLKLVSEDGAVAVAPYHDKVRQAVLRGMGGEEVPELHRSMATVFERHRSDDVESLMVHWLEAGERRVAGGYAERAATKASEGLAFERAAELFATALDLQGDEADRPHLIERLADAEAAQGRASDAAQSYQRAAALRAEEPEDGSHHVLALRSSAAAQYLEAGYYRRGWDAARGVLQALNLSTPTTLRSAVWSSTWRRLRYMIFGFRAPNPRDSQDEHARIQMNTLYSTALAFAGLSAALADVFRLRALDIAIKLGDADGLLNIYVYEANMLIHLEGGLIKRRYQEACALAARYAKVLPQSYAETRIEMLRMTKAYVEGDYDGAVEGGLAAVSWLADDSPRRHFVLALMHQYIFDALGLAGRLNELRERVECLRTGWEVRADLRGLQACYEGYGAILWLADDRPDLARRGDVVGPQEVGDDDAWPVSEFGKLSPRKPEALCGADLYEGDPWSAWDRVLSSLGDLDTSVVGKLRAFRVLTRFLRARVALSAAQAAPSPRYAEWTPARLLALAQRDRDHIAQQPYPAAAPMAALLSAGLAAHEGKDCAEALEAAVNGFNAAGMALHREVARMSLGKLRTDDRALEQAQTWMTEQGVQRPDKLCQVIAPGLGPGVGSTPPWAA